MKFVRYTEDNRQWHYGAQQSDRSVKRISGDIYGEYTVTEETAIGAKLLTPILPTSIWCIGLNYRQHAAETNAKIPQYPILFAKGVNTMQNPGDPIQLPTRMRSDEVDYECELAVVIGKLCKNATRANALEHLLGFMCANDVSARDWQIARGGGQWCRGKTFDTFSPLGPCLVTPDEAGDGSGLGIRTILNGETVQDSNTSDMIFDVPTLVEFMSGSTTLLPGTVILTGTPQGVGMARKPPLWLKPGDVVTIEIDKIGALTNPVENEV